MTAIREINPKIAPTAGGQMSSPFDDPGHCRARAEEARGLAQETTDGELKAMMLQVADGYDRLADRAEIRRRKNLN